MLCVVNDLIILEVYIMPKSTGIKSIKIDGSLLRDMIRGYGYSFSGFAEKIGIPHDSLFAYLNGRAAMPYTTLLKTANLLDVDPEYFTDDEQTLEIELRRKLTSFYRICHYKFLRLKISPAEMSKVISAAIPFLISKKIAVEMGFDPIEVAKAQSRIHKKILKGEKVEGMNKNDEAMVTELLGTESENDED